jgi:hypothetical protein
MSADTPEIMETPVDEYRRPRQRSRYDRPRAYISWFALVLGIGLGVAGGIFYTWTIAPVEETDTAPWQLNTEDRAHYLVAIMLNYVHNGDLSAAVRKLVDLRLPGADPIQEVANTACNLARSGYVDSSSGLRAIGALMTFYQGQGKSGCADELIASDQATPEGVVQVVLPTPTLVPPASKTPTPPGLIQSSATPPPQFIPTNPPAQRAFDILPISSFCSTEIVGVIEARVRDLGSVEIPGQPIRVRWDEGESTFYTGLKPERGQGYADFKMEPGRAYIIEMPGLSDPSSNPLVADPCFTDAGEESITSYQVFFLSG